MSDTANKNGVEPSKDSSTDQIPSIQDRWIKPANRMGTITIIMCIIATFLPAIYLNIRYDAFIGWAGVGGAMVLILAIFGVNWFVEPISYYPMLGNAGTYMGWLAGSVAQQRVPASVVARDALGVTPGSQEAEVVSVTAIAGSILINLIVLTATCFVGTAIIKALPPIILNCIAYYILPAMFGALLAMFGSKYPLLTIPAFIFMIFLNILVAKGFIPIPATFLVLIAIIGTIIYARVLYKMKKIT